MGASPGFYSYSTPCAVALAAMALLHSGAWVPSGMAQEPTRPPMYTMRVSPDTNRAMAHAEAQDEPGLTTVRIPPRVSPRGGSICFKVSFRNWRNELAFRHDSNARTKIEHNKTE